MRISLTENVTAFVNKRNQRMLIDVTSEVDIIP